MFRLLKYKTSDFLIHCCFLVNFFFMIYISILLRLFFDSMQHFTLNIFHLLSFHYARVFPLSFINGNYVLCVRDTCSMIMWDGLYEISKIFSSLQSTTSRLLLTYCVTLPWGSSMTSPTLKFDKWLWIASHDTIRPQLVERKTELLGDERGDSFVSLVRLTHRKV